MGIVCLESQTLIEFVEDSEVFDKFLSKHFEMLDADGDGALSRSDLMMRSEGFASRGHELQAREEIESMYDTLFERFDVDENGKIDRDEFRPLMREIMLAKARGIGQSPILIILQEDSLLMRAVEHGLAKNQHKSFPIKEEEGWSNIWHTIDFLVPRNA